MNQAILRLYPGPNAAFSLEGLYLAHDLRSLPRRTGAPFVYANFVASLDGRISEPDPPTALRRVPRAVANARDWRLYLELAAQADVLLTTAGHLRALAEGRQSVLFDPLRDENLAQWRRTHGLSPQPALAAMSQRLEIPMESVRQRYAGPLFVITGKNAPALRVDRLESAGIDVVRLSSGDALDGGAIMHALAERGQRCVYSVAGPRVTHALLAADTIDRLYLTVAHLVLGGREFDTFTLGPPLDPPARFRLFELYLDESAPPGVGQLLATYMRVH